MALGIDLWMDVVRFLVSKWSQVGINIDAKMMVTSKGDFPEKLNLPMEKQ